MPELPEVEIARRNLVDWWQGRAASETIVIDDELLVETEPEALVDALTSPAEALDRWGKYIVAQMESGHALVMHFRMTGKIVRCEEPEPTYARLAWRVGDEWLVFKDQRRLGRIQLLEPGEFDDYEPIQKMGPDALDVDGQTLCERLPDRRMLKTSLMDQEVVAGLGNIAASEIMWRMQLAPRIKSGALSDEDCGRLADAIHDFVEHVLEVEQSDEIIYLEESQSENPFDVYGREGEPCPLCETPIERAKVGGRSSYFCPDCQSE